MPHNSKTLTHLVEIDMSQALNVIGLCVKYDGLPYGGERFDMFVMGYGFDAVYDFSTKELLVGNKSINCPRCIDISNNINIYGLPSTGAIDSWYIQYENGDI